MATIYIDPQTGIKMERITQPIYSSAALATAGTSVSFFGNSVGGGSSVWNAAGPATLEDTNMTVVGSLPAGFVHHTKAIAIQFQPAITVADITAILKGGALSIKVAAKDQFQFPIIGIPGASGIDGALITGTTNTLHSGIADPRAVFPLDNELTLFSNVNITARIDWGTGVTLSATQPIRLVFYGWLDRPVQ